MLQPNSKRESRPQLLEQKARRYTHPVKVKVYVCFRILSDFKIFPTGGRRA